MTLRIALIDDQTGECEIGGQRCKVVRADDLYAAIESLGAFVSDEGWGQNDMDNMDNLAAAIDLSGLPVVPERRVIREGRDFDVAHYTEPCK